MSILNIENFKTRGNTKNDFYPKSHKEIQASILELTKHTLRTIKIFTPNLDHKIYNNEDIKSELLKFCRSNRHAQIQILVTDLSHAIKYGHRLVRLTQQIPSHVQIRQIPEEYTDNNLSYVTGDISQFIFNKKPEKSYLHSMCVNRTKSLYEHFVSIWEKSEQNPQTKTLNI
ncbi:MAG: hypothetical protein QM504_03185 [Pseudomonadota bacterium]